MSIGYYSVKYIRDAKVRARTIDRLQALAKALDSAVPQRNLSSTLLIATWNIREFDSSKFGLRSDECYFYIAEIMSRFDLIAVQEVRESLRALEKTKRILGNWWKYIVTDVTDGRSGNGERQAFLYDSRKVRHTGLAGEVVLAESGSKKPRQFARTPFICSFQSGWSKFDLCTVHMYYGSSVADDPRRVTEIDNLAKFLAKRYKTEIPPEKADFSPAPANLILMGDFNIFKRTDVTFKKLTKPGFVVPPELFLHSNLAQDKEYDQIAFLKRTDRFESTGNAGVFHFMKHVFRDGDATEYAPLMGKAYKSKSSAKAKNSYYKQWRTHQMSDHLPMWTELRTDFSKEYLEEIAKS